MINDIADEIQNINSEVDCVPEISEEQRVVYLQRLLKLDKDLLLENDDCIKRLVQQHLNDTREKVLYKSGV